MALTRDRQADVGVHVRELHLQIQLINLRGLLAQTKNEPRLKGPFPQEMYAGIIGSCQTLLDKLHSMRCVVSRQEWCVALI